VATAGKTIGIYLPLKDLIDFTFAVSKSASEKINDVILSVTRVAISTDAKFDFYCIIAHDVRIPEIQIVIIKSVDDVKRFLLTDISRSEYSKRMIIDMRLNPQAQKERALRGIFEKMKLDKRWQEDVLNDFFRAEPSELGEIGYWSDRFYLKDISLSEFLAEQIASRIKFESREEKGLSATAVIKSSKGRYRTEGTSRFFRFEFLVLEKEMRNAQDEVHRAVARKVLEIAAFVLHSYRFTDFDYVDVVDTREGKRVRASQEELENLRLKKLKFEDVLNKAVSIT
jgi:hypothetical protein